MRQLISPPGRVSAALVCAALLASCGGGGGSSPSTTPATATPVPQATSTPAAHAQSEFCTTAGAPQSLERGPAESGIPRIGPASTPERVYVPGLLEVRLANGGASAARAIAPGVHAIVQSVLAMPAIGRTFAVLRVPAGSEANAISALRSDPRVASVSRAAYRFPLSTTASFTNDPYPNGFAPDNLPPFYEASNSPGQWDLHVICAANAWGYGNANSTGVTHAGALGGTAPIAIIDTGADLTHPELQGRVSYAETVLDGVVTVGTSGMHDNDGHGTDVAGIAGAAANNNLGFAGVAYAAPLMIFRVFPDPPSGGCSPGSTNPACGASPTDIAQAIDDAVANGAKVINLSLGSTTADPAEEGAVASAIAAGVVVVAAAGNGNAAGVGQPSLDYPAADPGVIAVGASAIDDSNPLLISEKVASYSNYDGTNPQWGVVAPGGDPPACETATTNPCAVDDLHWIENIYTSTAADGSSSSACKPDFDSSSSIVDCRILIAGTSQASPHVAGAASLLLSVGASASQIKNILCSTATSIPSITAGCGRINIYKAMAQVVGDPNP